MKWIPRIFILMLAVVTFLSCQDEAYEVNIAAATLFDTSDATSVLKRITMAETAADNAIDSSNCAGIQLPFTVSFSGQPFQVTNPNQLDDFAAIPEGLFDGIVFPVTVVLADHSTVTVNSAETYATLLQDCGMYEAPITCVDLVYPITIYQYDSNDQVQGSETFQSDAAFYAYLTNLQPGYYFSLEFPIEMIYADGTTATVDSVEEFIATATSAQCYPAPDPLACLPVYLQPGLISWYGFASGSLDDGTGNMPLTNTNAVTAADRQGNPDCAYAFQYASGTFLHATATAALNELDALSVSLWYQPSTDLTDYEQLLGRGDELQCPDRLGQWSVGLFDQRKAVFGAENSVWSNVNSQLDTWYHLVATWDKSAHVMKIYIDGQLQNTQNGIGNCGPGGNNVVEDIGDFIIGRYYTGKIDDIGLYDRVLSAQEVQALHDLPVCCQ